MILRLCVLDAEGGIKAEASGENRVVLLYEAPYEKGDCLLMTADEPGHVVAQLEDSLAPAFGWLCGPFALPIPFDEQKSSYSPKCFTGPLHLLWARMAEPQDLAQHRNLALNPIDSHQNVGFFPHASANFETRGEAAFAARNAIDGNVCSGGHGKWPYESWGISRREDAVLKIDFGRPVTIDRLAITLRADFPHDNWWKTATIRFSDGSVDSPVFEKSGLPQLFPIPSRTVTWLQMEDMKKDATDESPFPALIQLEAWGTPA